MTKETKVTLITGFYIYSYILCINDCRIFITRATAYALFIIICVFIFDVYFFEQKTEC